MKEPEIEWGSAALTGVITLINDFEQALFASDFKNEDSGYRAHIDVDSFIDWFITQMDCLDSALNSL